MADIVVSRGEAIRVESLEDFGVRPVTLSLAPVGPLAMFPPNVETPTDDIEVTVQLVTGAPPRYCIAVRNRTGTGLAALGVESLREGRQALSAIKSDPFGAAIVPPGGHYTFDLTNSGRLLDGAGPVSPEPFDAIAITFVLWEDGRWEGEERAAHQHLRFEAVRRDKLLTIVPLLDAARAALPDQRWAVLKSLRNQLAREPYEMTARTVLGELERLEQAASAPDDAFERLADEMVERYTAAIERLSARAATSRR